MVSCESQERKSRKAELGRDALIIAFFIQWADKCGLAPWERGRLARKAALGRATLILAFPHRADKGRFAGGKTRASARDTPILAFPRQGLTGVGLHPGSAGVPPAEPR